MSLGAPKKVLIVDDSRIALFQERMILSQAHCYVVTAADGQEAIQKAESEQPDLIVMDVVMPKMNGLEACRELRSRESTRGIPIILVSVRGEKASVDRGYASGCSDYMTKPIDGLALLAKVRSHLRP